MSLRKFPFLANPRELAAGLLQRAGALEEMAGELAELCKARLEAVAKGEEWRERGSVEEEAISFWLVLMALREGGSVRLLERAIKAEVEKARRHIERAELEELIGLARSMGIEVKAEAIEIPWTVQGGKVVRRRLNVAVRAASYLSYVAGTREAALRLTNSFLLGGWVYMDLQLFRLFLAEALPKYILRGLREIEAPEGRVFSELVRKASAAEARASGVREELFPRCILDLMAKARLSSLSGDEVFVLLSFLRAIGAPRGYLEEVLRELGLARGRERLVARALEKVSAAPYTCEELKRRGICSCTENLVSEYLKARRRRGRERS
ncbi:MAG: hypothetical protein NZ902_03445 [Acidilobaceae archaeon]|nr:hypothetical protein [Acidilobaceae archaeon]MCX8165216.1 hypothetical protein [Acidilobaceae archaeon]MDW7974268.1 hypothetical protein [Sulfolobales archaeon]